MLYRGCQRVERAENDAIDHRGNGRNPDTLVQMPTDGERAE
jgi:hypothetical protein